MTHPARRSAPSGFTLTEMAIVLVIVALLLGGMLIPLGAQQDIRADRETQTRLIEIKEALLGFAAANGRLPCPASSTSGQEAPIGGGACTTTSNGVAYGYLPAATLGITTIDSAGHALDGWNQPIRYAVSANTLGTTTNPFTTASGMRNATMTSIASATLLSVCTSGGVITSPDTASAACPAANRLTNNAIAAIWSTGKNTSTTGGAGSDEAANPNPNTTVPVDPVFVYHEPAPAAASGGEFDDQVVWMAPNILFNRLITAGQLP